MAAVRHLDQGHRFWQQSKAHTQLSALVSHYSTKHTSDGASKCQESFLISEFRATNNHGLHSCSHQSSHRFSCR